MLVGITPVTVADFGVEDFALHHHPDDDFESMTTEFYVRVVESMVRVIEVFDADPASWSNRAGGASPSALNGWCRCLLSPA